MRRHSGEATKTKSLVVPGDEKNDNVSVYIEMNGDSPVDSRATSPNNLRKASTPKVQSPCLRRKGENVALAVPQSGDGRRRSSATVISAAALRKLQAAAALVKDSAKEKKAPKKTNKKKKTKRSKMSGGAIFLAFLLALAAVILSAILYYQLRETEKRLIAVTNLLTNKTEVIVKSLLKDCAYTQPWGYPHGVTTVFPITHPKGIQVFCDQRVDKGGWTVIQRRINGRTSFFRGWASYVEGWGLDYKGEFWIGLETIHQLTSQTGHKYELRIDMEDFRRRKAFAKYRNFRIDDASRHYTLHISGYSGTAGDGLTYHHNNMKFTTHDSDHDTSAQNCAAVHRGAWWYGACHSANLNGLYKHGWHNNTYADGINWQPWRGYHYSLKRVEMKIRRKI